MILLVISVLAVVQSLFGVGLLVFGTPTLLLLGFPFGTTLSILLPASITISALQVRRSGLQSAAFTKRFMIWCLIPLAAGLAAVLAFGFHAGLNAVVAVLLAVFVLLRFYPALGRRAGAWVAGHDREWLVLMGLVHGLSNLGGALLLIFAASQYERKEQVRSLIAFCYVCFALVQLIVLAITTPEVFGWIQLVYAAVAAGVFLLIGDRVFRWVSAPVFDWALRALATSYAGLLGLRAAGVL